MARQKSVARNGRSGHAREQARRIAAQARVGQGMLNGNDMGAPLAVERKSVEIEQNAFLPHDPDDKRSNGQWGARAQKVWAPDRLLRGRNPVIEQHHHDAATRFYDDFLIGECGARPGGGGSSVRLDPWARLPFSEQQAMRRQSFRAAARAVGQGFGGILTWCVLQTTDGPEAPPTVDAWAKRAGWTTDRAGGWLRGALEQLALHYGYARGQRHGGRG